jgi:hypothetical protein
MDADALGETTERYSTEYSGYFAQVPGGATYRNAFLLIKPVIADFNNGLEVEFCEKYWKL